MNPLYYRLNLNSNGGYSDKSRCHAGPFKVVQQLSTSRYVIAGGDGIEVTVSAFKLLPYQPTKADLRGQGCLAPSAVGASQSRLIGYEDKYLNSEVLAIMEEPIETVSNEIKAQAVLFINHVQVVNSSDVSDMSL